MTSKKEKEEARSALKRIMDTAIADIKHLLDAHESMHAISSALTRDPPSIDEALEIARRWILDSNKHWKVGE